MDDLHYLVLLLTLLVLALCVLLTIAVAGNAGLTRENRELRARLHPSSRGAR
jgi:hypothetical protein